MTITQRGSQKHLAGDGATVDFQPLFFVLEDDDLLVYVMDDTTRDLTLQTKDVDYTITGTGTGDLNDPKVTFTTAPASGKTVILRRLTPRTQQSDYADQAAIDAERLENDFDAAVLREMEIDRDLALALRFPIDDHVQGSGDFPPLQAELPDRLDRADQLLGFDGSGDVQMVDPSTLDPSTVLLGTFTQTLLPLDTLADWRSALNILDTIVSADVLANRPSAGAATDELFFATDTGQFFHSDGAAWTELGQLARFALGSLPGVGDTGRTYIDTTRFHIHVDDGSSVRRVRGQLPRGWISGFNISNNVTDPDHDLDISAGECRVGTAGDPNEEDALLTSSLTKLLDATWAEGDAVGGMAAGVTLSPDTWYHIFAIVDPSDGSVDVIADTSVTAVNVLADAAIVTAGYTKFRRIGSVKTDGSSNLLAFAQQGDRFIQKRDQLSFSQTAQNFTTATLIALSEIPPDVFVEVSVRSRFENSTGSMVIASADKDLTGSPSNFAAPLQHANLTTSQTFTLTTNTSQQVKVKVATDTSVDLLIEVDYYRDFRGQYD